MTLRLPRLPGNQAIVDSSGIPTILFSTDWQQLVTQLETTLNAITAIPEIQSALAGLATATADATAAAAAANTAASDAAAATAANAKETALQNSYIEPDSVLTATPTTISVAAHTRYYGDGTSAAVSAGTVAATGSGVTNYVSYSDPARTGGAVTFIASTTNPAQTGDIHVVGAVAVPTTGTATGGKGPNKPGTVQP